MSNDSNIWSLTFSKMSSRPGFQVYFDDDEYCPFGIYQIAKTNFCNTRRRGSLFRSKTFPLGKRRPGKRINIVSLTYAIGWKLGAIRASSFPRRSFSAPRLPPPPPLPFSQFTFIYEKEVHADILIIPRTIFSRRETI